MVISSFVSLRTSLDLFKRMLKGRFIAHGCICKGNNKMRCQYEIYLVKAFNT